jgi:glycosyltransferase involved in cell wall biosynthesis
MTNNPKVLFIGAYKDGTGWGKASQNYILAMDIAGINVVPRPIKTCFLDRKVDIPERILELEAKSDKNCDICIQHVLPPMMVYSGKFSKNIGIFMCESSHFKNSRWAEYLNSMDEIWICNHGMINRCRESFVSKPLRTIPLCFDISLYSERYEKLKIPQSIVDTFKFYTICEARQRKNIEAIINAFHLEFAPHELVSLIIKSAAPLKENNESFSILSKLCNDVKKSMKLYPKLDDYHKEVIISEWISDKDILRLHKTCDCFVLPSYGEAWGIPGFEAMAMGNPSLLTNEGGPADYIEDGESGILLECYDFPAFSDLSESSVRDIWIGNENWKKVDIGHLRKSMRKVYEDKELRNRLSRGGIDRAYKYSYEYVGNQIKLALGEDNNG